MSSAILYLAIVAIWAGVLIPRWLKRDTTQTAKSSAELAGGPPAEAGHDAHIDGADGEMAESEAGLVTADDATPDGAHETSGVSPVSEAPDYEVPYEDHTGDSRTRMLSARRRMLMILCTLTVAALGITVLGMAAWWVTIPPILMLGGYIMLLREASRADREQALMREAAWRDEQEHRAVREARRAEAERKAEAARKAAAAAAETAHVIDISERVRDELYDQYADEARRAVGD
ncbi:MAG TPA: hypothetical protein VKV33_05160 [Streptosporangiaceae bacterium]|nr:hypothetical protein [Streptosporangiaceae bacterium]